MTRYIAFISGLFIIFSSIPDGECQGLSSFFGKSGKMTGYLNGGLESLDIDSINSSFDEHAIPNFSNISKSFGGGSRITLKKKIIIGIDFSRLLRQSETYGVYRTKLTGSMRTLSIGYVMYENDTIKVYPMIGAGRESLSLKITDESPIDFDDLLNEPKKGIDISKSGWLLDLGIQFDKYSKSRQSYRWGLKAGYRTSFGMREWKQERVTIGKGPDAGIDGLYLQLNFGLRDLMRELFSH